MNQEYTVSQNHFTNGFFMKHIAIITGASTGIGLEIARIFAEQHIDILIVARDKQKLENIKQRFELEHGIHVHYVPADLSTTDGYTAIIDYVKQHALSIGYLVNNAGFGDYGDFIERDMMKYVEIINLNITALTALTHHFAKLMVSNGYGRILNVASTAGFQPDPHFAVYGATKSYVMNFSEALHKELENTGVTVTVLSPGATKTEFIDRAEMGHSKLFDKGVMSASEVARVGYEGMIQGKLHVIPGFKNRVMAFFSSITPSSKIRLDMTAKVMSKKDM